MTHARWWLGFLLVGCCPLVAAAQGAAQQEVVIIYKDGYALKGRIHEKASVIYDAASGRAFPLFSGNFFLDDHVRNILFSRGQIQLVEKLKPAETMSVTRMKSIRQFRDVNPKFRFQGFSSWNEKGDRTAIFAAQAQLNMLQKVALLTPHHIFVVTDLYRWDMMYFTQEFGPTLTRDILFNIYNDKRELKEMKDAKKLLEISTFLREAGWYEDAEKELQRCITNFPGEKKIAQVALDSIHKSRATLFVDGIDQAANVGQHQEAIARLATYDREGYQKLVAKQFDLKAQDLKGKYDTLKADIDQAKSYLKLLPAATGSPKTWTKACEFIEAELNYDTVERLETFLKFAQQFEQQRKEKSSSTQSAEEVLALAISGWLQGKTAADHDAKTALKLAHARQFILDYLRSNDEIARADSLSAFKRTNDLQTDVLMRLIRMIPPSHADDGKKFNTEIKTMTIEVPQGNGGSYLVQLPPDYQPLRAYPVLLLLASSRDKAEENLKRFSAEAVKYGFILASPVRAGKGRDSESEHPLVLDTLRDLRRRFQVDSDRVFLFGWEDGATLALDVGLGHPDLFAGVVPMNATMPAFTRRWYWPNAQYLPLYIIEGERNAVNAKAMRDLFKEWSRDPYMVTYVEYRGRASEWYSVEVPLMMDWMSRKKRHYPRKEMGRLNLRGGLGEEFRTSRPGDSRFYWLSTQAISERCQCSHSDAPTARYQPATLQASYSIGNKVNSKKEAAIWNQIDIWESGLHQVTVWITPDMMDLEKPLLVRVNGKASRMRIVQPSLETMLEELRTSGDRQRLFVAKIELKL